MTSKEFTTLASLKYSTEPDLAVGLTGITQLKSTTFKSRFTGSKRYIVDRDGKLLPKYKPPKQISKAKSEPKKKKYSINKTRIKKKQHYCIKTQKHTTKLFSTITTSLYNTPHNLAYSLLNSWLTTMRTAQHLKNYLWVAERQQNSTIHFHIAHIENLQIMFANGVMKNLLHFYIRKQKLSWSHLSANRYNGVDIAKNRKTGKVTNFASSKCGRNLSSYLTKYISKSDTKFERQAWQCSKSVSGLFTHYTMTVSEFEDIFLEYIDISECLIVSDFFNFFRWAKAPPPLIRQLLCDINNSLQQAAASPVSQ